MLFEPDIKDNASRKKQIYKPNIDATNLTRRIVS